MSIFVTAFIAALVLLMAPYALRLLNGPTVFDRVVAMNGIGTKVPVALVLVGFLYEREDMFVDLALAMLLLNLIVTLLVAIYVRERRGSGV